MENLIIGITCIVVAIILFSTKDEDDNNPFILLNLMTGFLNIGIGIVGLIFLHDTYIVTINRMDGTSIEVETQNYDISDEYIKVKQDDGDLYIYEVKDVKVTKKDK